ncbi:MAG: class I SAM-dependent methyltransferase [Candidatus Thiodiazotropha endolucinida]|nr:class I SAM-dependent methyltransferase [Candidatus Thiodiazotropha taylori]MBT3040799.1 class I SAM-dependent methyltransferase [Candidatus Thiodiazotropha sp. (ex Codakia orbicularis)]MBT3094901.1 class I SAM-dependent methyltransferase [Candidatus Thiodiazotropha sp. (ex Lucina pensylvanica)]MCG8024171.1 class I SAM-dependent methyltransferase [Candidatus Thiodiazotropha endolucinida]
MAKRKKKSPSMAKSADRHHLYELSVQCAEAEIDFVDDTYKKIQGRRAKRLREDFCGTANVCCEWVRRRKSNLAIGIDLDKEVLDWGRDNQLQRLKSSQQKRIRLIEDNVLSAETEPMQIISAMNFSYWLFKERTALKNYFQRVHGQLAEDGILFMDAYGGYDSYKEIEEEREIEDGDTLFTYIWEQEKYDPISGNLICHIHFEFEDGSRMERAFSYDWRLWSLPEIHELLNEVGFSKVTFYWQGFDDDGEPDGVFLPVREGEADAGWICYITAEK